MSAEEGQLLGILPKDAGPNKPCLYSPWQIRGILATEGGFLCLAKGMLVVNHWLRSGVRIRSSCSKLESSASAFIESFLGTFFTNEKVAGRDPRFQAGLFGVGR